MNRPLCTFVPLLPLALLFAFTPNLVAQWTPPTPEELSMTSQPEVPGAAAVYLFREEMTDDKLHVFNVYVRLKVLTEAGKEYANVELKQYSSSGAGTSIAGIAGRTIHSDGTVIPFTGKPFEKLIEKGQDFKVVSKVFSLPAVDVGSIIEYRYQLRYNDMYYIPPEWYIQSELFTRKGHYLWRPTEKQLVSKGEHGEELTSAVSWTPLLPKGTEVKQSRLPPTSASENGQPIIELNVHDVPPSPNEENMPPMGSISYRVLFYYSPYRTGDEYWKSEGKGWSKNTDKFIGPDSKVKQAVAELVLPSDTADQKLRKIYAAVMKLDNTSYSGAKSADEERAQGLGPAKSAEDIWQRKRGRDDEIAELFIAMARAAGLKAYAMRVSDRDHRLFLQSYLSFDQLDDTIAIVLIDAKEMFFDPGQRYCAYGHLAWKHTGSGGVRQTDNGTSIVQTPAEPYTVARTQRVANLTMDEHGEVTGSIKMTWAGDPALNWRHTYLHGDQTSLNHDLRTSMEQMMPGGMDVKVDSVENLEDYEKPLVVSYTVKGPIGSPTGKRLLVPGDLFESNTRPSFPHEKRETSVLFNYARTVQDAVRINLPPGLSVESAPTGQQLPFGKYAVYVLKTETAPSSITIRREFDLGYLMYSTSDYPALRAFYNKMETQDREPIVLRVVAPAAGGN